MSLVKYVSPVTTVNDVLTIDNKELLLISLLETLCQIVDSSPKLFSKICNYLYKIGILENPKVYSDDKKNVRKLYMDYLIKVMRQFEKKTLLLNSGEISTELIQVNQKVQNNLQLINSQYSNNFIELESIGEGGFGEVFKVYNQINTQKYAIKKVPFFDINDPNNMRAFNEVRCLAKLNHRNVVRYHTTWLELCDKKIEDYEDVPIYPILYIQMELCSCSLKDYLMKRNYSGRVIEFDFEKTCISGIIEGLKYIHSMDILHRDINTNNIFLDEHMIPKIGDFGMAVKVNSHEDLKMSSNYGVSLYMPPEYTKSNIYTKKSDVYSTGIVLFELLYVFSTDMERYEIINKIRDGHYPESFVKQFDNYYKVISRMICENIEERLSSDELKIDFPNI